MANVSSAMIFVTLLVGAATIIGLAIAHEGRARENRHREHMKALEMGLAPPGEQGWAAATCMAIGGFVPTAALVVALIASLNPPRPRADLGEIWSGTDFTVFYACVWGAAITVGLVSVVSGALLAWILLGRRRDAARRVVKGALHDAPYFDPYAYDTVSARA